jgi:hypothetical protein
MKIIEKEFNVQTGEETITEREETAPKLKKEQNTPKPKQSRREMPKQKQGNG